MSILSGNSLLIQYARRFYNGSVRIYNTRIQSFPLLLIARPFHFHAAEYGYALRYRTSRLIGYFENHDELYWNVTGLGWSFTIERHRAGLQREYQ